MDVRDAAALGRIWVAGCVSVPVGVGACIGLAGRRVWFAVCIGLAVRIGLAVCIGAARSNRLRMPW